MAEANLKVQSRKTKGKQEAKRLRQQGLVPGILYGSGMEPVLLALDSKELLVFLHTFGRNRVINLVVGKKRNAIKSFIYDIQHHPISGDIIHIDLKHISMEEKIHVSVPVHLIGIPFGVKSEGGIIEHISHTLTISALPDNIPVNIPLEISDLKIGDSIHVRDLNHDNFDFLSDEDTVVVHIITPKVVLVEEAEVVEEEEEEPAEPEVIGEEE